MNNIVSTKNSIILNVNPVGSENTSLITAEELSDLVDRLLRSETASARLDMVVAFGQNLYDDPQNSYIIASSKESTFRMFNGDMWERHHVVPDLSGVTYLTWDTSFGECTERNSKDMTEEKVKLIQDNLDEIREKKREYPRIRERDEEERDTCFRERERKDQGGREKDREARQEKLFCFTLLFV